MKHANLPDDNDDKTNDGQTQKLATPSNEGPHTMELSQNLPPQSYLSPHQTCPTKQISTLHPNEAFLHQDDNKRESPVETFIKELHNKSTVILNSSEATNQGLETPIRLLNHSNLVSFNHV